MEEIRIQALQELLRKGSVTGIFSTAESLFCDQALQEIVQLSKLVKELLKDKRQDDEGND